MITRSAFVSELRLEAAKRSKGGTAVPYDFPRFDACAAAKRSGPDASGSESRQECKREFERLRPTAMRALLQGEWLKQDAAARGLSVSAKELNAEVRKRQRALGGTTRASGTRPCCAGRGSPSSPCRKAFAARC